VLIGLTGGIASGKSTVAKVWESLGGVHVDADLLAREVVSKGSSGLAAVVDRFGSEFLDEDGNLNRVKLAELIFTDEKSRSALESILHPLIQNLAQQRISQLAGKKVFYTIPLLVETNSPLVFDKVVTVSAPEEVRIARLINNRGLSEAEARKRILSQATDSDREAVADYVIDSNCSLEELKQRAKVLWLELTGGVEA
jgi:dephospho-CoA kinase